MKVFANIYIYNIQWGLPTSFAIFYSLGYIHVCTELNANGCLDALSRVGINAKCTFVCILYKRMICTLILCVCARARARMHVCVRMWEQRLDFTLPPVSHLAQNHNAKNKKENCVFLIMCYAFVANLNYFDCWLSGGGGGGGYAAQMHFICLEVDSQIVHCYLSLTTVMIFLGNQMCSYWYCKESVWHDTWLIK